MNQQQIRLTVACLLSLLGVPLLLPAVTASANSAIAAHNLGWANPGGVFGVLAAYSAALFFVTSVAATAQRIKRVRPEDGVRWGGAFILIGAVYSSIRYLGSSLVGPEFGFLAALAATAFVIVQLTRFAFPEYRFDPYISGPRLFTSEEVRKKRGPRPPGLMMWGADYISQKLENLHVMIFGNIGGGKTTLFKMIQAAVAKREGELWLCFDPKQEWAPYLAALGKKVVRLNPLDKEAVGWALHEDFVNSSQAEDLVKVLLPEEQNTDQFWLGAARRYLQALIEVLIESGKPWGLRTILLIVQDRFLLAEFLMRNPKNKTLAEGLRGTRKDGEGNDFSLTLYARLAKFAVIASLWDSAPKQISVNKLFKEAWGQDIALVLGTDYQASETLNTINYLFFSQFYKLSMNLPNDTFRRIRVWIDEVSTASSYLGSYLVSYQTLVRSKGGCVVIGAQNYPGLVDTFGEEKAKQIIGLCLHVCVVGGVDGPTAEYVSREVIGDVQFIEESYGESRDPAKPGDTTGDGRFRKGDKDAKASPSWRISSRRAVPKEQLLSSTFPKTGPDHGMTGLFIGGEGGMHFHTYPWREVIGNQVQDDKDTAAYNRIDDQDPAFYLKQFTPEERAMWGIPDEEPPESEQTDNDDNSSDQQ